MPAIKWPSGQVDIAKTWEELEAYVQSIQFEEYDNREDFRKAMAERALNWHKTEIETDGTSRDFFYELERAQMCIAIQLPQPTPIRPDIFGHAIPDEAVTAVKEAVLALGQVQLENGVPGEDEEQQFHRIMHEIDKIDEQHNQSLKYEVVEIRVNGNPICHWCGKEIKGGETHDNGRYCFSPKKEKKSPWLD